MSDARLPQPDSTSAATRSLPRAGTPARPAAPDPDSLYVRAGGEAFFTDLVAAFYGRVADDPVLRPLYPEPDLAGAEERLRLFLIQFWGGPTTYSQQRGHPRLRMRHAPFTVGSAQIEAWLSNMEAAIKELDPPADITTELWEYFSRAAPFLRNVEE